MKLVRYEHHGFPLLGVISHGQVQSLPQGLDVLEVLNMPIGERNLLEAQAGRRHRAPLGSVRLLPPIEPRAMRDFVAFERHIAGMKKGEGAAGVPDAWYEAPVFLFMNPWSVIGAEDDVPAPPDTSVLDFELEIAAVVGRTAHNVSEADAGDYIAGYCVMNDWSARDLQSREMSVGLGPSKGKDFATSFGPVLVTPEELLDADGVPHGAMVARVNGEEWSRGELADLHHGWGELIAHASRDTRLVPGDVIGSGTVGTGCILELGLVHGRDRYPYLVSGDEVELEVDGIGVLRNRIA